jgi:uncharacterized protein with GYD domain
VQPETAKTVKEMVPPSAIDGRCCLQKHTIRREVEHATLHVSGSLCRRFLGRPAQEPADTVGRAACEAVGGKLVASWYCFGDYDLIIIADVPDNESMTAIALAIAAGGAVKSAKTTVLMSGAEAVAGMKKAGAVAKVYKPAR